MEIGVSKNSAQDPQVIELLGRNHLVGELLRANLEVALPQRDRGIDLIVYADLFTPTNAFIARPIQMKAASEHTFAVDQKYEKFPDLIIAYIWHLCRPGYEATYALTYVEAVQVATEMGWTKTISWQNGVYSTTRPSQRLRNLLEPYLMTPEKWWVKITHEKPTFFNKNSNSF
jgi:hypothetical protein